MTGPSETPLITVGICCYNAADTIERAISSALAQDWPNLEVLVVDDTSTDDSAVRVEALARKHDNLTLIRHPENCGPGEARNTLLTYAKGDFIALFDDDDESAPERIAIQHARIVACERETGAELVASYASGERLYPSGYRMPIDAIGARPEVPHGKAVADYLLFYAKQPDWFYGAGTPACALMARRTALIAVGGFDGAFRRVEDIDLAIRLALAGAYFVGCPERLYLQHSTQASDKSPEMNLGGELQLVEKHQAYLRSVSRYVYAKTWPRLRYHHFKRQYGRFAMTLLGLLCRAPLKTVSHLIQTGPRRLLHERRIAR
ncbi:MAG: glycosyltransferase family 2 protein [Alphaproteobacteria bacterium]